ncbi:MAG: Hpt domain-containing protein [Chlorobiaceae bacterium]|jgi:two-component system, sensor histidine kinase and response regulator|nr:Hpt domain-containing protein [Chlorobiaceae bacterium]
MNSSSTDIFNFEEFLKRMMDDRELAQIILGKFREDLPGKLVELEKHIDGNDFRQVASLAHLIKGEAANIGADLMSRSAYSLEFAAKSGNMEEMKSASVILHENARLLVKSLEEKSI